MTTAAPRRQPAAVARLDPPVRFYTGSLRHEDSIILRKSKLRQVQLRHPGPRLPGEGSKVNKVAVHVIDTPSDDSNGDDFDGSSEPSPRSGLSPNRNVPEVGQGHTEVVYAGTRPSEFEERNCRGPTSIQQDHRRRRCCRNDEARLSRNSTNKLTVILSAVDLPYYSSRPALRCECRAVVDVGNLPHSGWRCRQVAQYLHVLPPSRTDGRLRQHPAGTLSRKSDPDVRFHPAAERTSSSSPSPELFPRENSSGGDYASQLTPERRVYALARAYSDRVKQLQRRPETTHDADDFDDAAIAFHAPVHRARARSVSVGRRTALPLSPIVLYR